MSIWDLLDRAWAGRSETIDATPATRWVRLAPMGSADGIDALTETIGRYNDAWNDHDVDAIVAMHAPDMVFANHTAGESATGEEVRGHIGADSLAYLSIPGLIRAIGRGTADEFCRACFDGSYPVPVPQQLEMDKMQFEPTPV